jgi:nitrile hydratase accessory protein
MSNMQHPADSTGVRLNTGSSQHGACPPGSDPERVFHEPWEAHAFAMALDLHARGLFTWKEWTEALARELAKPCPAPRAKTAPAAPADSDPAPPAESSSYYRCWLAALETLVVAKGLVSASDLARCALAWDRAADRTPHGQPIELQPRDYV